MLWGLGMAKREAGGFQLSGPERAVAAGGWTRAGMGLKNKMGCGRGRIDFLLTGSESDVRQWKVCSHCYGVWEWRGVGPVDFQL